MSEFSSFRSIIDLWPTRLKLSVELEHPNSELVRKWWQRNNVPAEYWGAIVALPVALDAGVTLEVLARLAAREREVA
jgi:hypothetical protein